METSFYARALIGNQGGCSCRGGSSCLSRTAPLLEKAVKAASAAGWRRSEAASRR